MHKRPEALTLLPAPYGQLFDRVVAAAVDDGRVRALWLGGSFARGEADAASDLDFLVAVADNAFVELTGHWREWVSTFTETAFAEAHVFAPGMYYAATADFARFDLTVERAGAISGSPDPGVGGVRVGGAVGAGLAGVL